jgi:hypothetical protein
MVRILAFGAGVVACAVVPRVAKHVLRPAAKCTVRCFRATQRLYQEVKEKVQEEFQDISAEVAYEEELAKQRKVAPNAAKLSNGSSPQVGARPAVAPFTARTPLRHG